MLMFVVAAEFSLKNKSCFSFFFFLVLVKESPGTWLGGW